MDAVDMLLGQQGSPKPKRRSGYDAVSMLLDQQREEQEGNLAEENRRFDEAARFNPVSEALGATWDSAKSLGLAAASEAGKDVSGLGAAGATFLQAPAANTLTGVIGGTAAADRGLTWLANKIAGQSPKTGENFFRPNQNLQEGAELAARFAADARKENAESNAVAGTLAGMAENFRDRTKRLEEFDKTFNPEFVGQKQNIGEAEGALGMAKAIIQNPTASIGTLFGSVPSMALGVGVAGKAAQLSRAASAARGVTGEAADLAAIRVASTTGALAEGATQAAHTRESLHRGVMDTSVSDLAKDSPMFNEMVARGMSAQDAREALANTVADQTVFTNAFVTAIGTKITAKLLGGDTTAEIMAGKQITARQAGYNPIKEGAEETIQGVGQGAVGTGAESQADKNAKMDVGGEAVQNFWSGTALGTAGTAGAYMNQQARASRATRRAVEAAKQAADATQPAAQAQQATQAPQTAPADDGLTEQQRNTRIDIRFPDGTVWRDPGPSIQGQIDDIDARLEEIKGKRGFAEERDKLRSDRKELTRQAKQQEQDSVVSNAIEAEQQRIDAMKANPNARPEAIQQAEERLEKMRARAEPTPTPEPEQDLLAQVAAVKDGKSGKDSALITPGNSADGLDLEGLHVVQTHKGTYVTSNAEKAKFVEEWKDDITDEEMSQLLGYQIEKTKSDGTVVQSRDKDGNIVHQEATTQELAPAAAKTAQAAAPDGAVEVTNVIDMQAERQQRREQEDGTQADQAQQAAAQRAQAPEGQVAQQPVVLQNRDRSTAASISQMNAIAANPDYLRTGPSRTMDQGAPVVFGDTPAGVALGRTETVADGHGNRIQMRYAVVDAGDVITSNAVDGTPNADYENGVAGKLRAVAGNARAAGLAASWDRQTAGTYRQEMLDDAASTGIDQQAIEGIQRPMLVRLMDAKDVTPDVGDRSNIQAGAAMSAVEQANNDVRRVNVGAMSFDERGVPTPETVKAFINAMPQSERGAMIGKTGEPTQQALARVRAAAFKQAYGDDALVELAAQATDPEAKTVLAALASVAGDMAQLDGAGEFDIRGAVTEAARMAVTAVRRGLKMSDTLREGQLTDTPEARIVGRFMAENIRSGKRMAEGLRAWVKLALEQVQIVRDNGQQGGMFGDEPTLTREQLFERLGQNGEQPTTETAGKPGQQAEPAQHGGPEPVAQGAARPAAQPRRDGGGAQDGRGRPTEGAQSADRAERKEAGTATKGDQERGKSDGTDVRQVAEPAQSNLGQRWSKMHQEERVAIVKRVPDFVKKDGELNATGRQIAAKRWGFMSQKQAEQLEAAERAQKAEGDQFLESHTKEDLKARQDAKDKAERQQAKDDAKAEDRAKADAQRGEFTLTGSNRAADANPNQGGLFQSKGDNAANRGSKDGQQANGIPQGLRAERTADTDRLEKIIDRQLERDGEPTGFKALAIGKDQLPDALRGALAALERATGTRVVVFRNLTPGIADFNGVTVRDGVIYVEENSQNPVTSTAAHEWVHNLRKTNPELYQLLADEVLRQGDAYGFAKEYGYDISQANEELTASAVGDALTDPVFLQRLAERDQSAFKKVVKAFIEFLNTLAEGWKNQGSNAYLKDVEAFRDKLADVLDQLPVAQQKPGGIEAMFLRMWHGTPHRGIEYEGFKLNKIGTGEGAQAYGWGIYGAGQRKVAEEYSTKLGKPVVRFESGIEPSTPAEKAVAERITVAAEIALTRYRDEYARQVWQYTAHPTSDFLYGNSSIGIKPLSADKLAKALEMREAAKRLGPPIVSDDGQLYSLDVPVEDGDLLDWDKPLSEQPEKVREALAADRRAKDKLYGGGGEYYRGLVGRFAQDAPVHMSATAAEDVYGAQRASEYLLSIGIPGLRYLDGNSRNNGQIVTSNYVIWDESLLTPEAAGIKAMYSKKAKESTKRDLIITHNLSSANLLHAAKMGGLAAPSLAITTNGEPLDGFGNIVLIGKKEMADPKNGAKVFGADIYSPRYPNVERKINRKQYDELVKRTKGVADELQMGLPDGTDLSRGGYDALEKSGPMLGQFLKDNGIKPRIVFGETMSQERADRLRKFGLGEFLNDEDWFGLVNNEKFRKAGLAELTDMYAERAMPGLADKLRTNEDTQNLMLRDLAREISTSAARERHPEVIQYPTIAKMREQIEEAKLSDQYEQAVEDVLNQITTGEVIFTGFTNAGNRRYIPHTLENVIKTLKKDLRGGEGFNYGVGSLRAKVTPQFKSVAAIRASKNRLVSDKQFAKLKDEIDNQLVGISRVFHESLDRTVGILEDAASRGFAYAQKEYGIKLSDGAIEDATKFLDKLRELPTAYFEAKLLRTVYLSEFAAAVVPDGASARALKALKDGGIERVETYKNDGDSKNSRRNAVKKLTDDLGDEVLFSRKAADELGQQGYIDGRPYRPEHEALSAADKRAVVDAYNANATTKLDSIGKIEDSDDIGAKSRAFQALAQSEGWHFGRDAEGAKYFWIRNADGATLNVRVSDHANVNRGEHYKTSDINIAPDDGQNGFDTFSSALWKMRRASLNDDGDTLIDGEEPVRFSRKAAQPSGATVSTITDAIHKAYGNVLEKLQAKGLVTLVQSQDEAVKVAAQARAAKTGQQVGRARASLQSSIRGEADELSMSIYSDEAGKIERALDAMGLQVSTEGSRISQSTYVIVESPEYTQTEGESGSVLKIRVSDHLLPGGYQQPDFEVQVGNAHQGVDMADAAGAWFDAVSWVGRRFGIEPKGAAKRQIAAAAEKEAKAKQAAVAAADQQRGRLDASKARLQAWLQSLPDGALWGNARRGGWVAVLDGKMIGRFDGETATGEGQPWYGGPYPVEAQKNLQPVRESLRASVKNSVADRNFDPNDIDIRRSASGSIQGFYDPQSGQSFLIADGLTDEAAPGVLIHEVGIHMAADKAGGRQVERLFRRAGFLLKNGKGKFFDAVRQRMESAGETGNEEAAAYIAEEYERNRQSAPESIARYIREFLAEVKAWLSRQGVSVDALKLGPADIAAIARANIRALAAGQDVADAGQSVHERSGQYQTDLFGDPVPLPKPVAKRPGDRPLSAGAGLRGDVPAAAAVSDTPAPAGTYLTRTIVGQEVKRKLGASRITTPAEAAQATHYLYRNAVERFDGIVTDKDGKPLGVVGGFKGAIGQSAVYPGTLVAEAVRIPGAAHIWFSHNHPSGNSELSISDIRLSDTLTDALRGSGIEPMGILAVSKGRFSYYGADRSTISDTAIPQARFEMMVPVVERELVENEPSVNIHDVASAVRAAKDVPVAGDTGMMLLDSGNRVVAWVPITKSMLGNLRGTGGLNAIYRAVSETNAAAAILVHTGLFDQPHPSDKSITVGNNIAAALAKADVRPLDIINADTGKSLAKQGLGIASGPAFSRKAAQQATRKTAAERADDIINTRARGQARPLEAVTHAATRFTGIEYAARKVGDVGAWTIDRITSESIKAGLVADYGLPEDAVDARAIRHGRVLQQLRRVGDMVDKLSTLTAAEAEAAYEWMTSKDQAAIMRGIAMTPKHAVPILREIRQLVTSLGQEAVDLGILPATAYERNKGSYLHRSYEKYVLEENGKPKRPKKTDQIMGDNLKQRGISKKVTMSAVQQGAPEWWDIARKEGKADPDLIGRTLIKLQRRANSGQATQPLEGMQGRSPGRVLETVYVPADKPIPQKYSEWDSAGEWEIRNASGDKLDIWRDYTPEERKQMGEIRDVRYAILTTFYGMVQDIEMAKYFRWVANNHSVILSDDVPGKIAEASEAYLRPYRPDEWVLVPDTKVPGTGTPKYGALAGRYVPGPVWNDIRHLSRAGQLGDGGMARTWNTALKLWKISKTSLAPVVHMNNIMSNFVLMEAAGLSTAHVLKALTIIMGAHDQQGRGAIGRTGNLASRVLGISDADAAREIMARYRESGGELGSWAIGELQRNQIDPIIESLNKQLRENGDGNDVRLGVSAALQYLIHGQFSDAARAFWQSKPNAITRLGAREAKALIDLYGNEDTVFRVAAWLKAKEDGKTDIQAGKIARRAFMDYDINAPWVQLAKSTALPFISFTYRALPLMAEMATRNPHKLMKLAIVYQGLSMLFAMMAGGGDDDDDTRALLPDEKSGGIWGLPIPKLVRMPWNTDGNPVFLDIRRWVPLGDVVDLGESHSAFPLPPALLPSGILGMGMEVMLNKSQFTGKPITLDTDTRLQKTEKIADWLYKSITPNIIGIPGTYATQNVVDAVTGKTDTFGRQRSVGQAISSGLGFKVGTYPKDVLMQNQYLKMRSQIKEIDANIWRISRQLAQKGISQEKAQELIAAEQEKKNEVARKYQEKIGAGS